MIKEWLKFLTIRHANYFANDEWDVDLEAGTKYDISYKDESIDSRNHVWDNCHNYADNQANNIPSLQNSFNELSFLNIWQTLTRNWENSR